MSKNPLTERVKALKDQIEELEDRIAMDKGISNESELALESIEKFCEECDLRGERECHFCILNEHYMGKK